MKKLLILAVAGFLAWKYLPLQQWSERYLQTGVYDEQGNPAVALLVVENCTACDDARSYLKRRHIDAEIVSMERDEARWKELGSPNRVPVLMVGSGTATGFNDGQFLAVLAEQMGDSALTSFEQRLYARHFDSEGNPRIVLYGTDWCPYCKKLREDFAANNVDYLDYDVEKPYKQVDLLRTLSIGGYPTVYIGYKRLPGARYRDVMKAL